MTSLSQTALEFARECLGWADTRILDCGIEGLYPTPSGNNYGILKYTDITSVTTSVHEWCRANHLQWAVFGNNRNDSRKKQYLAFILPHDDYWEGRCESDILPYALLTACVEANRKLEQQTAKGAGWVDEQKE